MVIRLVYQNIEYALNLGFLKIMQNIWKGEKIVTQILQIYNKNLFSSISHKLVLSPSISIRDFTLF